MWSGCTDRFQFFVVFLTILSKCSMELPKGHGGDFILATFAFPCNKG